MRVVEFSGDGPLNLYSAVSSFLGLMLNEDEVLDPA